MVKGAIQIWPISEKFADALSSGHVVASRVDLLTGGQIYDLTAAGVVVDGSVQCSSDAVRRTMSCTLVDPEGVLLPFSTSDLLAPKGGELRFWRGINYMDGSDPELVPIGTFIFTQVAVPTPKIELTGYDRSWVVSGAKLETALTIAKGTDVVTAIIGVLHNAYGANLETNFPDVDETTPEMLFDVDSDPWTVAQQLASNIDHNLYFDPLGVATMTPTPDIATSTPAWKFDDTDVKNLGIPGIGLAWDITDAVNAVIVIAENSDNTAVFRGVAKDLDPTSPTYYDGPIGHRPITIRDEKISSQAQAAQRAQAELRRRVGLPQTIEVPSIVNPAFDVGDIVEIYGYKIGSIRQLCVLDKFNVPLRAKGSMTLSTRQRLVMEE